jgi:hypothetical protein
VFQENIIRVITECAMGEACRTHVNKERCVPYLKSVNLNGRAAKHVFDHNIRRYVQEEIVQLNRCLSEERLNAEKRR